MATAIFLSVVLCFALTAAAERPDNSTTQMEEMFEDGNMAQSRTRKYRDTESTYWSSWKKHGSRSFLFVNREMTWTSAEKYCQASKAHLASIHSPAEYAFIQQLVRSQTHAYTRAWIGASDGAEALQWLWSDGSSFLYHDWSRGQPDNLWSIERCVEINYPDDYRWNDRGCWDRLPFICGNRPDGPC